MRKFTYFYSLLLTALFLLPWSGMKATVTITPESPYTNDFNSETTDAVPSGWTHVGTGSVTVLAKGDMTVRGSSGKGVRLQATKSQTCILALPQFSDDPQYLTISFYRYKSSYNGSYSVGYITDLNDVSTYVAKQTFTCTTSYASFSYSFDDTAPAGSYIAIYMKGTESNSSRKSSLYIDDVTVTTSYVAPPTGCTTPTDLEAAATSSTSAMITWSKAATESAWQLRYREKDTESWSSLLDATTTPARNLTTLTTDKTYEVQVRSNCGEGDENKSDWTDAAEFSLASCPSVTSASLSGKVYNSVTVNCALSLSGKWNLEKKVDDGAWESVATEIEDATKAVAVEVGHSYDFRVKPSCGDAWTELGETYAPAFPVPTPSASDITDAQATVSWSALLDNPNYKYIRVAAGSDAPDAAAWASAASTAETSVTLTGLIGGTGYDVYVRAVYAGGEGTPAKVSFTTGKIAPTDLVQGETTTNSIAFSWSYAGAATQFEWRCNSTSWTTTTETSAVATGLSAGQDYNVEVRAVYAEGIYSAILFDGFTTACAAKTLPYSCGFETTDADAFTNNGYNNCWKKIGSPAATNSSYYRHTGTNSLRVGGTDEQYVILPEFADAVKGMQISFWYQHYTYYASTLVLGTMTDPTDKATFTEIQTLSTAGSYTNILEKSLAGAGTNDHYIAFKYTGSNQYSAVYLDDISVTVLPTCPKPSGVTIPAANITGTTAEVSWTNGGSETAWKIQTSNDGSTWGEEITATTNPFTLTGLTPNNTTYYVRVKADCGGGDESKWSDASEPFLTPCATISSFPWEINFNGMTENSIPGCWDNSGSTASGSSYYKWGVYTYNSNQMIRMCNYFAGQTNGSALINTPSIVLPASPAYELGFDYTHTSTGGNLIVKVSTDDGSTFNPIEGASYAKGSGTSYTDPGTFTPATINLSSYAGQTIILQFYADANYGNGAIFVDNLSIHEVPSCPAPTAVVASSITNNSASISWTNGGEESSWKLQYKASDASDWTAANEGNAFTTKPFALSGLEANTTYNVQVKAVNGTESDWSTPAGTFTTDCDPVNMPFEQAFAYSLPECWRLAKTDGYDWSSNSSYKVSSSYSMYYYANTSTDNYSDLITPMINLAEDAQLKFYLRNLSSVVGEVYIQYGSTTTKLADFATTTAWEQQVIDLADYTGENAKFIFRAHGAGTYLSLYIDDVEVKVKPCDAPTALNIAASSTDATITWTDEANSKWNLQWREVGAEEWNTINNLEVKTLTLTSAANGLEVGKTYEVQVQTVCPAKTSAWYPATAKTFELVCNAPTALAVTARTDNSATFSWTSSESAWVLQYSADGENWESENVAANPFTLSGLTAGTNYQAKIQSACGSEFSNVVSFKTWCNEALTLPVALTSFTAVHDCWEESPAGAIQIANNKLCFVGEGEKFLYLPKTAINLNLLSVTLTFGGSLELGYISEPNGAFTSLVAPVSGTEYDLATLAPEALEYLAIRYNGANSWAQASISAINIRKTPTCAKLDAPTAAPTVGGATITWTAGSESAWNLQYKLASASAWTDAEGTIASPFVLSGLEQGVSYKVRVRANCGEEGVSDWSDEATFTTDCDAINALPFIETFDAALSNCWTIFAESSSYTPAVNTFSQYLNISGGRTGNSENIVAMPAISADLTNAVLSFEYRGSTGSNYAQLEVGYLTDKEDASTFNSLQTLDQAASWTEARVAVNGLENKYIAFKYAGGSSQGDQYIKNLRVLEQLTLADGVDNTATLTANLGKAVDVTIGRTLFCDGDYNTICLPFDLPELDGTPLAGATVKKFKYAVIGADELQVRVIDSEEGIKAGVPYLIKFAAGENIDSPLFKNVTISVSAAQTIGQGEPVAFVGTFAPVAFTAGYENTLFVYTNNTLRWASVDSNLKAFRAYFNRTSNPSAAPLKPGMRARIVEHVDHATGVENVQGEGQAIKLLENNQVVIIRNGVKYTIQGQKIQ